MTNKIDREGKKKLSSIDKAIKELREHQEWVESQRMMERIALIDKYYTQDGQKYHARKIGDSDWQIEELDEFPFVQINLNNL